MAVKAKSMALEQTIVEERRFTELDDYLSKDAFLASGEWDPAPFIKPMDNRKPTRTRLRLTEWFEGAPFCPAIRQRPMIS